MSGYKYKLQNILELKENIEKEKKNQFGSATQRLEDEKEKLKLLNGELAELHEQFQVEAEKGIPVGQLKIIMEYVEYYKRAIVSQLTKIKMAEDYLEECRKELIKASQERKMMEKLKAIDHKKYLYEEQKKEEKLIDDLVTFKESRKTEEL